MSRNGSGTYSLPAGNPVVTGTTITSTWANNTLNDIANALTQSIASDGQTVPTANLPMGGYKFTGLAAGTTNGDSIRYEQVIGAFLPITGGTLTGNLLFTDATYDIGASGATRPRDFFLSRNAVIGGTALVSGALTLGSSYTEGVVAIGNSGASQTLSLSSGTFQTVTLTANCTFTMPTATAGKSFVLIITQDGTGSRTATFTGVKWAGSIAPTITTTATTGRDIASFFSDGTNWYGSIAQNFG